MSEIVEAYTPHGEASKLRHYTKIYHLGDPRLSDLLSGNIVVEEKVDGSQFRFGVFDGKLRCGSHRVNFSTIQDVEGETAVIADKLFQPAVDYLESIVEMIPEGIVFYGETLAKPKHNTIAYGRVPNGNIYLFDMFNANGVPHNFANGGRIEADSFGSVDALNKMANTLGLDVPNVMWQGSGSEMNMTELTKLLATDSYLGGSLIEGIVIKNYALPSPDPFHPLTMMGGKLVRKSFKEENDANWKGQRDIMGQVFMRFKTPARYEKAWVHLREEGKLEGNLRDIKGLMEEVRRDIMEETKPQILDMLWDWYERDVVKGIGAGLPEWYKEKLTKTQLGDTEQQ